VPAAPKREFVLLAVDQEVRMNTIAETDGLRQNVKNGMMKMLTDFHGFGMKGRRVNPGAHLPVYDKMYLI